MCAISKSRIALLEEAVEDQEGSVLLAKLDINEYQVFAQDLGVGRFTPKIYHWHEGRGEDSLLPYDVNIDDEEIGDYVESVASRFYIGEGDAALDHHPQDVQAMGAEHMVSIVSYPGPGGLEDLRKLEDDARQTEFEARQNSYVSIEGLPELMRGLYRQKMKDTKSNDD